MPENIIAINKMEDEDEESRITPASEWAAASRKERRKAAKKEKRKKKRKDTAVVVRQEEDALLHDPVEQLRLQAEEEMEKERAEKELRQFEERERMIQEEWARRRAMEEAQEEMRRKDWEEKQTKVGCDDEVNQDECEYVEEGPPDIIWQGNEIIVKKRKVRVKKIDSDHQTAKEDPNRRISNPLPPQSEAFTDYRNASVLSAQQLLEDVAQQTPNFGTEQDKAHCPFHLKTGACRFGSRCSRIHFYPEKSCTFLIKNMYNGPGLAWEHDEGLEYTDEEVECAYEEFYEDVHTEFLKFGEMVNFKVCRNGSSHLRGNVYVHYKALDSAELAYYSVNGRYYGGRQLQCEFVGVTKWKVAICGEYMKSKFTTCSRGMTCNFIHCFRNPGGDYEWADWDKPPPKYWVKKVASLFGYCDESVYLKQPQEGSPRSYQDTSKLSSDDADRYRSKRSQSKESDYSRSKENDCSRSSRNHSNSYTHRIIHQQQRRSADRKKIERLDEKHSEQTPISRRSKYRKSSSGDSDWDRDWSEKGYDARHDGSSRARSRVHSTELSESLGQRCDGKRICETIPNANLFDNDRYSYVRQEHVQNSTKHWDKRHGIQDERQGTSSTSELGEDRHDKTSESSSTNPRKQKKLLKAPDDRWERRNRMYDNNVNSECSDGERGACSSPVSNKKSSKSDNSEEFEDDRSQINSASNLRDCMSHEDLGRQKEETGLDNSNLGNCTSSALNSSRGPKNDICKLGRAKLSPNHDKKVKRKRDEDKSRALDQKGKRSNVVNHNGKRSHPAGFDSDEDLDERGRWESDNVV